jgi:hypothetical protein
MPIPVVDAIGIPVAAGIGVGILVYWKRTQIAELAEIKAIEADSSSPYFYPVLIGLATTGLVYFVFDKML